MFRFGLSTALAIVALGIGCSSAAGLVLQPVGTFAQPVSLAGTPGAPSLLVGQRKGQIFEVRPTGTRPIGDLSTLIVCCESEQGLLSIAPAPDFASSSRFYAAYTGTAAADGEVGDVHVDSFRPDPQGGDQFLRERILSMSHTEHPNHHGGQLQFGPDGYLYISTGDGGGEGDPLETGQDTETLLGKILRIDPRPGQVPTYEIPVGNPFVAAPGRDEIWAYGLRNPWRFSFDRVSGGMVIGDVGQAEREEVDFAPSPSPGVVGGAGANYGWNCREGLIPYPGAPIECSGLVGFTDPVFDYVHQNPAPGAANGCSIIGGYVVRDPALGELSGRYLYADYCTGQIRSLALPDAAGGSASADRAEGLAVSNPTSFGEDSCGQIYVASRSGAVYRLLPSATAFGCGAGGLVSPSAGGSASPSVEAPSRRVRLRLWARDAGRRVKLVVHAVPCAGEEGARVQLNRGGKRFAVRKFDRRCLARFFTRVTGTFQALLRVSPEIRSRRLVVDVPPDRAQRSQVRTIALAKPRP